MVVYANGRREVAPDGSIDLFCCYSPRASWSSSNSLGSSYQGGRGWRMRSSRAVIPSGLLSSQRPMTIWIPNPISRPHDCPSASCNPGNETGVWTSPTMVHKTSGMASTRRNNPRAANTALWTTFMVSGSSAHYKQREDGMSSRGEQHQRLARQDACRRPPKFERLPPSCIPWFLLPHNDGCVNLTE